jgi:hypothetical protein
MWNNSLLFDPAFYYFTILLLRFSSLYPPFPFLGSMIPRKLYPYLRWGEM